MTLSFTAHFFGVQTSYLIMPITRTTETNRPTQSEFGQIAYEVMNCVYEIHNQFGRFFDEAVYKRELAVDGASFFHDHLISMIQDWGSGLETGLYEEALTHFLGGEEKVMLPVPVTGIKGHLHDQKMRLLAPDVAFKITAFPDRLEAFAIHSRRLLQHTSLKGIHWANITHKNVTFTTVH
jgi:hypothetical protein